MGDADESPTWILLRASHFLKDNRLPRWVSTRVRKDMRDMAIVGNAAQDVDFNRIDGVEGSGADVIHYRLPWPADGVGTGGSSSTKVSSPAWRSRSPARTAPRSAHGCNCPPTRTTPRSGWPSRNGTFPGRLPAPRVSI